MMAGLRTLNQQRLPAACLSLLAKLECTQKPPACFGQILQQASGVSSWQRHAALVGKTLQVVLPSMLQAHTHCPQLRDFQSAGGEAGQQGRGALVLDPHVPGDQKEIEAGSSPHNEVEQERNGVRVAFTAVLPLWSHLQR